MRTTPRPRHRINPVLLAVLRPLLRYSYTREAYVLRLVGNHRGPVLVRDAPPATIGSPQDGGPSADAEAAEVRRHTHV